MRRENSVAKVVGFGIASPGGYSPPFLQEAENSADPGVIDTISIVFGTWFPVRVSMGGRQRKFHGRNRLGINQSYNKFFLGEIPGTGTLY